MRASNLAFIGPGRHRKDPPGPGLWPGVLPETDYKTYYLKATRAEGQTEEGRRFAATRLASRRRAGEAVLPHQSTRWGGARSTRRARTSSSTSSTGSYEKDGRQCHGISPATRPTSGWDEFFTGDDTLLCTLDRLFDRASVFVMKGASFRGAELEIFSVETTPLAVRATA